MGIIIFLLYLFIACMLYLFACLSRSNFLFVEAKSRHVRGMLDPRGSHVRFDILARHVSEAIETFD